MDGSKQFEWKYFEWFKKLFSNIVCPIAWPPHNVGTIILTLN